MKRFLTLMLICILLTAAVLPLAAEGVEVPQVVSPSAVLMDAQTGAVLYQKNMTEKRNPASVSKIVTVLLGIESGKGEETTVVSEQVVKITERDSTHLSLVAGEEVKLNDMFYAAMMMSAHDAANVIAESVAGSVPEFVEKMNARMKDAGATGTRFTNADGSRDADNYTTAEDIALFTKEALKNETFRTVFGQVSYTMPATNKNTAPRNFNTICYLLRESDQNVRYTDAIGGKTGWDEDAKYTMVSAAEKDGRTLICVILGAPKSQTRYTDTVALFDYGFAAFRNVAVPTTLLPETEIPVMKDGNIIRKVKVSIPEGTLLTTDQTFTEGTMFLASALPTYLTEGATDLHLTVSAKDETGQTVVLGTVVLTLAGREVELDPAGGEKPVEQSFGSKVWKVIKIILLVLLIIIGALVLIAAALFAVSYIQREKRKRIRRQRQEERRRREQEEEAKENEYVGRRFRDPDAK